MYMTLKYGSLRFEWTLPMPPIAQTESLIYYRTLVGSRVYHVTHLTPVMCYLQVPDISQTRAYLYKHRLYSTIISWYDFMLNRKSHGISLSV